MSQERIIAPAVSRPYRQGQGGVGERSVEPVRPKRTRRAKAKGVCVEDHSELEGGPAEEDLVQGEPVRQKRTRQVLGGRGQQRRLGKRVGVKGKDETLGK